MEKKGQYDAPHAMQLALCRAGMGFAGVGGGTGQLCEGLRRVGVGDNAAAGTCPDPRPPPLHHRHGARADAGCNCSTILRAMDESKQTFNVRALASVN